MRSLAEICSVNMMTRPMLLVMSGRNSNVLQWKRCREQTNPFYVKNPLLCSMTDMPPSQQIITVPQFSGKKWHGVNSSNSLEWHWNLFRIVCIYYLNSRIKIELNYVRVIEMIHWFLSRFSFILQASDLRGIRNAKAEPGEYSTSVSKTIHHLWFSVPFNRHICSQPKNYEIRYLESLGNTITFFFSTAKSMQIQF